MSYLLEGDAGPRCRREDTQGRERPDKHGWASSGTLSRSWRGNKCKLTQHASTHSFTLESGNFCPRGIFAGTEHAGVTLNQVEAMVWQPRCPAARGNSLLPQTEASSRSRALDTAPDPAFLAASSLHSLILIQYPHVFVCEEVQKRNVANSLVNITHCNFFGNPVVGRCLVSNCQRLSQDVIHQLLCGL